MGISGSQDNNEKKPVVLILGGGYAGIECAKTLDKSGQFFVVLIDRKSYFLHNVAALRATVERDFAHKIMTPYDRLLTKGCFVQAEVASISADGVRVHGRQEPISFDYLIIATGTSYAFPAKVADPQMSKAIELYNHLVDKVQRAEHILLIGGGPVGIELAAEIGTDFPGKKVTLVHNQPTLLRPGVFNEKLYPRLYDQLEKLGVQMILNDRIEVPKDSTHHQHMNYVEGKQTFVTERSKQSITADLTFVCVGAHVNNKSILNGSLKSKINPQTGRLMVNNYLQVDGFENIFAVGDICDKEEKMAFMAGDQAKYICKLIPLLHKKKPYPKEYEGHRNPAIFLSLGRNGGIGQLPTKSGTLLGNFPVRLIKSKSMMTDRFKSALNYESSKPSDPQAVSLEKLHSIQSMLSLSEEEAQHFLAGLPVKDLEPGQDFI